MNLLRTLGTLVLCLVGLTNSITVKADDGDFNVKCVTNHHIFVWFKDGNGHVIDQDQVSQEYAFVYDGNHPATQEVEIMGRKGSIFVGLVGPFDGGVLPGVGLLLEGSLPGSELEAMAKREAKYVGISLKENEPAASPDETLRWRFWSIACRWEH